MLIVAAPSASRFQVGLWLAGRDHHPRFVKQMAPMLWDTAIEHGLDPVGVVCQSYKETAGGRFSGAVKPWMKNTCGLRIHETGRAAIEDLLATRAPTTGWEGDAREWLHRLSHETFATWRQAALGHVQQLLGYVGVEVPVEELVTARYRQRTSDAIEHWRELGGPGSWAPSESYGAEIEQLMGEVHAA